MSDERITDELVVRVLGWTPAPDRFLKTGRSWIPRWRFQPLKDLCHALELLAKATDDYSLTSLPGGTFTAAVRIRGRVGITSGRSEARTITLAIAQALEFEMPQEVDQISPPIGCQDRHSRGQRSGS